MSLQRQGGLRGGRSLGCGSSGRGSGLEGEMLDIRSQYWREVSEIGGAATIMEAMVEAESEEAVRVQRNRQRICAWRRS